MPHPLRAPVVVAVLLAAAALAHAAPPKTNADPLLAIDMNRSAIIADIVKGFESQATSPGATRLRAKLENLRADRLLAASLASSRTSLDAILVESETPQSATFASVREKALGDANRDLVYTPIVPCPIVNTFTSPIGRLPAASITAFDAIAGDFAAQGGQNSCATQLPTNMAAIAAQIAVVSPSNEGWLNLWPVGQTLPNNVTLGNYRDQAGDLPNIVTNSALVPLCTSACAGGKEFNLYTASEAVVTIAVVGYFAPPLGGAPGAGTVTSVATGTGLTGGPITTTGTISVANGGIGSAQLADGAVTFAKIADGSIGPTKLSAFSVGRDQVNPGAIQLRLSAVCSRGVPLIGIGQDGSPICHNPTRTLAFFTSRTSVAIRADGRPVVARDGGNLHDCADANCTSGTDINLNLGGDVAMALRTDGRPVVAVGNSFSQLLAICGDATCSNAAPVVTRTLDSGSIGTFSVLALRADNTPLVSYFEFSSGQTRLYVCNDPSCASGTIRTITASPSYTPSALRIRPNGTPVITLRNYFGGGHALYDCNDASCSSGTIRSLGGGSSIRFLLGLAVRSDNRAVVVNTGPVMHDCADAACTSNSARSFDNGEFVSASAAVIRANGRPLLAYGTGSGAVKLFDCGNAECTFGTVRLLDQTDASFVDAEIALTLRADGRPVLSYPAGNGTLRLLSCQNATCQ